MFGIDFSEILVIFGIALVVLGPERLPKLANTIGRWVGRARSMARQFREQLEQETGGVNRSFDLRTEFNAMRDTVRDTRDAMRSTGATMQDTLASVGAASSSAREPTAVAAATPAATAPQSASTSARAASPAAVAAPAPEAAAAGMTAASAATDVDNSFGFAASSDTALAESYFEEQLASAHLAAASAAPEAVPFGSENPQRDLFGPPDGAP